MRALVVQALRKDGHDVVEASDGGRLLVRIAEAFGRDPSLAEVDVVVSDVRMPVCSGLELVERLFEARWNVAFILMTAFSDDDIRRRAHSAGALLLDKPLRLDDLRAAVSDLMRRALARSQP